MGIAPTKKIISMFMIIFKNLYVIRFEVFNRTSHPRAAEVEVDVLRRLVPRVEAVGREAVEVVALQTQATTEASLQRMSRVDFLFNSGRFKTFMKWRTSSSIREDSGRFKTFMKSSIREDLKLL